MSALERIIIVGLAILVFIAVGLVVYSSTTWAGENKQLDKKRFLTQVDKPHHGAFAGIE